LPLSACLSSIISCESIAARQARLVRADGFGLLRLALALAIVVFHSFTVTTGGPAGMPGMLQSAARLILPAFFALSGFLVAASLARCADVGEFALLRLLRILPALGIVVAATALLLGPLLSALPPAAYFADRNVPAYFGNILFRAHYVLPGLFESNPRATIVNGSLWTIPLEMSCYGLLAVAAFFLRGRALTAALGATAVLLLFPNTPFLGLLLAWLPAKDLALAFCIGALLFRLRRQVVLHTPAGLACLGLAFIMARAPGTPWPVLPLAYGVIWLGLRQMPARITRDYSYGLYLTAYPLQQSCMQLLAPSSWWVTLALTLPVALLAAALLWHGVEAPLLSRKHELIARLRGLAPAMTRP
jgi:peptidoglycan/LPS O-acetylase OafA/YrhL